MWVNHTETDPAWGLRSSQEKATHLIEEGLQHLVLRPLLCKISLGLGALVLDPLLASVLLHRKQEADDDESERDYEQLQPVPKHPVRI